MTMYKNGLCNEAAHGVTACIILPSGCCAWIPYHIVSAIKYAPPPPGDTIYHYPLAARHSDSGCGSYSDMLSCWHRMYAHTYIHTE